jgi:uncharacterized membrane protein YraQ (UPF0718 family)
LEQQNRQVNLWRRFWGQLCFIGFYTLTGALIAAVIRTCFSWTLYNVSQLSMLRAWGKIMLILFGGGVYHCGGMWTPVIGELKGMGLSLGTGLGFILFGQATRWGHLMAFRSRFTTGSILLLIGLALTGSLVIGLLI